MKSGRPNLSSDPPRSVGPEVTLRLPASAEDLDLALRFGVSTSAEAPDGWQLLRDGLALALRSPRELGSYVVTADPTSAAVARRLRTARPTDPLPRAIGMPRRERPPQVWDATAGLGRDALVLASLGCRVTAIERVPALAMLLVDAAARLGGGALAVVLGDALERLKDCQPDAAPEVVYLDPMFEEAGKAQVKKEMQACRALAVADDDPEALLAAARGTASERVVVKRHPHLPPLGPGRSHEVAGERVRFDVYLTKDGTRPR